MSDFSDEIVLAADLATIPPATFDADEPFVPILEGKLVGQFDHRFASYPGRATGADAAADVSDKSPESEVSFLRYISVETALRRNPALRTVPAVVVARDIARSTDHRSVIAAIVPTNISDYTLRVFRFFSRDPDRALFFVALLNSFALDFFARQKLGGTHLANFILEELPVPDPSPDAHWWRFVVDRSFELTFTSWKLEPFARQRGWEVGPFVWSKDRRGLLRHELDALFFHMFGFRRADVDYVMESFPIVKRSEERAMGEYRTKRVILERYDALAHAIASGEAYKSMLDPPPADPRLALPAREEPSQAALVIEVPFRRIADRSAGSDDDRVAPIYTLGAAAGALGGEAVEPDGWAELNGQQLIRPGMFVAQVRGHSMEPHIPDGAWCLFTSPVEGSRDGRILLVKHQAIDDPDNRGSCTVKRYGRRKWAVEGELWEHEEIVLEPLNPEYEPIVLRDVEEGELRVIAELVEVLQ